MEASKAKKSPIKQRILQYISHLGVSKRTFYSSIGISRGTLESNSGITEDIVRKFLDKFPEVSPMWIFTGEGPMLTGGDSGAENAFVKTRNASDCSPYFDIDFVGGLHSENKNVQSPTYYIDFKPYNEPGIVWCNICGRSMEPELSNGDIMAIKEMNSPVEYLPFGEIYAIVTEDYRTVKRITKSDREGHIRLVPSNPSPEYAPQDIKIDSIKQVYKVIGCMKRF
jgi:hypothetical protein